MTGDPETEFDLSDAYRVALDRIRRAGELEVSVEPTEDERRVMADALGIPDVAAAAGRFVLLAGDGGLVELNGRVTAELTRSCVVTLQPLSETLDSAVDMRFTDSADQLLQDPDDEDDPMAEDPPDLIENGEIDLMKVVYEVISLEMDAYPRQMDAEFVSPGGGGGGDDGDDTADHPFAALEALKNREK